MTESRAFQIGIALLPGFSMMSLTCLIEPLRGANQQSGQNLYHWSLLSSSSAAVSASCGLTFATERLPGQGDELPDFLVVCGGHADASCDDRRIRDVLRRAGHANRLIGAVSTAGFLLASTGLLDGRRCTTHWEYIDSFREAFPRARLCRDRYVVDGRILTCGGGLSTMDMMLDLITRREGRNLARSVAENFIHDMAPEPPADQRSELGARLDTTHPTVVRTVTIMEANCEAPLAIPELAARIATSERQMERLFGQHLGCTPARFYLETRLEKARKLLHYSNLSVTEIGLSCGFSGLSNFSRSYRNHFGVSPSASRRVASTKGAVSRRERPPAKP